MLRARLIRLSVVLAVLVVILAVAVTWMRSAAASSGGPRSRSNYSPISTRAPADDPDAPPKKPITWSPPEGERLPASTAVQRAAPSIMVLLGAGLGTQDAYRMLTVLSESGSTAEADPVSPASLINRTLTASDSKQLRAVFADIANRLMEIQDHPDKYTTDDARMATLTLLVCAESAGRCPIADKPALVDALAEAQVAALFTREYDLRAILSERARALVALPTDRAGAANYAAVMRIHMERAAKDGDETGVKRAAAIWRALDAPRDAAERAGREKMVEELVRRAQGAH